MVSQEDCNVLAGKIFGLRKESSASSEPSKRDFEVYALGVESNVLDSGFSYVTGKRFIYVGEAMVDVIRSTLGEHLNRAVRQVPHKACQPITIGNVRCSEAEPNTLNPPDEDYMFRSLVHFWLTIG
jgi:hypothetical protein